MDIIYKELNGRSCRTYLVYDKRSREAIIIDPVIDLVEDYLRILKQEELGLRVTIDTHTHADHLSGGIALKEQTHCDYLMHGSSRVSGITMGMREGSWYFGDVPLEVMHTPGHTKDSISLIFPDRIFVGDLLFLDEGGAGRLDLPGGDAGEHWESLQRILGLPDHLTVYPAHDYRNCTPSSIVAQKMRNQYLQPRTRDEYLAFAKSLRYGPAKWMEDVLRLNEECQISALRAYVVPNAGNTCENVCEGLPVNTVFSLDSVPAMHISAQELNTRLQSAHAPVLLDVREADELAGELPALPGIIHIPVGDIVPRIHELISHKEESMVVICRSGKRALRAARMLIDWGFKNVCVLSGGMLAWEAADKNA